MDMITRILDSVKQKFSFFENCIKRDIYFKNRTTELIAIPFVDQSAPILVGIVERTRHLRSEFGQMYMELLKKHLSELSLPGAR